MIFQSVDFYKNVKADEDALGNPIFKEQIIDSYPTTLTEWSTEEIALLDRAVTQNNRKMLTHANIDVLKETTHVYINGTKYTNITLKSDFKRWRLCYVKEYKA